MTGTGAPKCRFCGKEEWRHICGGLVSKKPEVKKAAQQRAVPSERPLAEHATAGLASRFDKKAYQKRYMRGYRRRQALWTETLQAVLEDRACLLKQG